MQHMVSNLVCLATVAGLGFGAFAEYSAADYSQDGLELQLDAIDNAGTGEHDPAATVWKDLAGKHDFTLASGGSWSGGNSFYMNGSCAATAADLIPNTYLTAEIVYASTGKKSGYILFTGNNLRALYDEAGARLWYSTTTSSGVTSEACASPTGTNHFAAVYAVGGDLLEQVYADGAPTDGCAHSSNWNSYTKYAVLGARGTGTDAPSQARVFAIRLYNRKLGADEIRRHYALDRARFFGDTTLIDQLSSFVMGAIPAQKILSGSYAEPLPEVTDVKTGATLTRGTDYEITYRDNAAPGTATVVVTGKGAYVGLSRTTTFEITRVRASEYVAGSYVRTGLIAQFDGVENAGIALPHDPELYGWKDLSGHGWDWVFRTQSEFGTKMKWTDNSLYINSTCGATIGNSPFAKMVTVEFVWRSNGTGQGIIMSPGFGQGPNLEMGNGYICVYGAGGSGSVPAVHASYPVKTGETHITHVVYSGTTPNVEGSGVAALYVDGQLVETPGTSGGAFNCQKDGAALSGRSNNPQYGANGYMYALRVYDRELTPQEIWWNYAVDRDRFFGDRSALCDMAVDPIPVQYAVGAIAARPVPVVKDRWTGEVLEAGTDYSVAWSNNTSVGTGYVIVTGRGDQANTETVAAFTISRPEIAVAEVPPMDVRGATRAEPKPAVTVAGTEIALVEGTDFTYSYKDNTAPGTAKVIVTGIGDYEGIVKPVEFTILSLRAEQYGAENYIRNGLVAQWDGIGNTTNAAGEAVHDAAATSWLDLSGNGYDWNFGAALGTDLAWQDNALYLHRNDAAVIGGSPFKGKLVTVEFIWSTKTVGGLILSPGIGGQGANLHTFAHGTYGNTVSVFATDAKKIGFSVKLDTPYIAQVIYTGVDPAVASSVPNGVSELRVEGEPIEPLASGNAWDANKNAASLCGRNKVDCGGSAQPANGYLYALRIYDRVLTADELLHNYAIDRARFFNDYSVFCDFTIEPLGVQLYDGVHPVTPDPVVRAKADGAVLVKDVDYTLTYTNNASAGTATLKVIGKGEHAGMSCPLDFVIHQPIYVAATACGAGDGSSWANATTLAGAAAAAAKDDVVILKTETMALAEGGTFAVPCKVWGGYAGDPTDPLAKADGAKTVLDGGGTVPTLVTLSANTSAADRSEVRDIVFTDAKLHGFVKSGATGLLMENCDFIRNGLADTGYTDGRGAQIAGSSATVATLRNCTFRFNMATNNVECFGNGVGLNVGTFKRVELESCSFVGNGLAPNLRGGSTQRQLYGAALYSTAPVMASGCEFRLNHTAERDDDRGGAVCLAGGTGHVFSNCTFVANSGTYMQYVSFAGGTVRLAMGLGNTATFERCTFAYNLTDSSSGANVNVYSGRAIVRNCVFSDAIVSQRYTGGKYIHVHSGSYCEVSDTLFPSGSEADAVVAVRDTDIKFGKNVHYADACFVTPTDTVAPWAITESNGTLYFDPTKTDELESIDVHLRNSDGVYSAAIDQGAEEDAVGDEPMPNANRLNLGAYGGTAEAATSAPDAATIASFAVTWPDGYTLPKYAVTLGGADGALYNADVEVFCATGAQVTAGEWTKVGRVYGLHNGGSAEIRQDLPLVPGDGYTMRVIAYNGPNWVTNDISGTVEGELPLWYGKGGGASVLHVWANAVYEPDGSDWSHAYRTLADAVAAWDASKTEIWIAGDLDMSALVTFKPSAGVAIRGGFTGAESAAEARFEGVKSTLDGLYRCNILSLQTAAAVTLDCLRFVRSSKTALEKTGAGDLTLVGCEIVDCGTQAVSYDGHGANLKGSDGATLTITGCLFAGNVQRSYSNGSNAGMALYLSGFASATIDASAFETNGIPFGASNADANNGGVFVNNFAGVAIYDNGVPLTLTHCRFRGNRGTCAANRGGIVVLAGAVDGSRVENCAFIGNQDIMQNAATGPAAGALVVNASAADAAVLVKNCTFARNISSSPLAPAALSVAAGDVAVRNCIFHGNVPLAGASAARDVNAAAGATLSLSYSMFDCTATTLGECVSAPDGASLGEGTHTFGDPLFAADALEDGDVVTTAASSYFNRTAATLARVMAIDVHLRSPKGYFLDDGGEVIVGADLSPAIDAGLDTDSYDNELPPNGSRINLGAYGNTAEASRTSVGQPEIAAVEVGMQDERWSRPEVRVTLGGEASAKYNAEVTIVGMIGGVEVCRYVKAGVQNGETVTYAPEAYYDKGQVLAVSVKVTAGGAETRETAEPVELEITGERPPWDARGGDPATTLHVWADAPFTADGRTWATAYRTLPAALAAMDATKSEIWIAGDCPVESGITLNPSASIAIRGGFTASETAPGQRPEGARSTLDANKAVATHFTLANGAGIAVTFDGLGLVQATTRAVSKSASAGDLTLVGCVVASNGLSACNDGGGHGLHVTGSGAARLVVSNCVFRDQTYASQCGGGLNNGGAINATSFARVEIVGSSFVNNGGTFGSGVGTQHAYRNSSGRAVYVKDSPVSLRGCSFLGNRGTAGYIGSVGTKLSGGTVALVGACGGSEIRNCRFLGNANDFVMGGGLQSDYSTYGGGALLLNLTDATQAATVENCTFAWNVGDAYLAAAGVSVATGRADIRNCVFAHNRIGKYTLAAKDVSFGEGAEGSVSYSLFDGELKDCVSQTNATVELKADTLKYGDPAFVSTNRMDDLMTVSGNLTYFKGTAAVQAAIESLDCHLRGGSGYRDETTGEVVKDWTRRRYGNSPAIDAGDPKSAYRREPTPCGWRVNMGAYGNTPWATMSKPGTALIVR